MTEEEWEKAELCGGMIQAITRHEKDYLRRGRLLRQFAVLVLHDLKQHAHDSAFQSALATAEEYLDGEIGWRELEAVIHDSTVRYGPVSHETVDLNELTLDGLKCLVKHQPHEAAISALGRRIRIQQQLNGVEGARYSDWLENAISSQYAKVLREYFHNPFRPIAFDPSWRTSTAVALAQTMYDSREFGAMPILADALQDAGCEDDAILSHCRGDGPHVRGCWVVDLILRKA